MSNIARELKELKLAEGRKLKMELNLDADPTDVPPRWAMVAQGTLTDTITSWFEGEWSGAWALGQIISAYSPPAPQVFGISAVGEYDIYCVTIVNGENKWFQGTIKIRS